MQGQLLFFAMAPVLAFALVRWRGTLQEAVLGALVIAALEAAYNSAQLGRLEPFSLGSLALFGIFGALSLRARDERLFRLQPVALELALAVVFAWAWFVQGTPLLAVILDDHVRLPEILPVYQHGYATLYATTLSRSLPLLLLAHAAWTAWAAWYRSRTAWLLVRVPAFYVLVAALFLLERLLGVRP